MTPRVATASSTWHSTEGVPLEGCPARISVPGAATARPAFKLSSVNVAVVLGFMILMRIEGTEYYTRTGGEECTSSELEFFGGGGEE